MNYNLLFDTEFKYEERNWKFINCYLEDGYLKSTDKVFGVEQSLILPDPTKVYLRCKYNSLESAVKKAYIGIQIGDTYHANDKWVIRNKEQYISVVEDSEIEKINIKIIFESDAPVNIIKLQHPILYDLGRMERVSWLKTRLDKSIKYRIGYDYINLLPFNEISPEEFEGEPARIGTIISTLNKLTYKIDAKLLKGKHYLLKLDYKQLNTLGKTFLSYGIVKSESFNDEQEIMVFKASEDIDLLIHIDSDDVLPYIVNLKNLLLVDTDTLNGEFEDFPYLPFI